MHFSEKKAEHNTCTSSLNAMLVTKYQDVLKEKKRWSPYKTFRCIIHKTKLKTLFVFEAFSQGMPHIIGWECFLSTVLKLCKYRLESNSNINYYCVLTASMVEHTQHFIFLFYQFAKFTLVMQYHIEMKLQVKHIVLKYMQSQFIKAEQGQYTILIASTHSHLLKKSTAILRQLSLLKKQHWNVITAVQKGMGRLWRICKIMYMI